MVCAWPGLVSMTCSLDDGLKVYAISACPHLEYGLALTDTSMSSKFFVTAFWLCYEVRAGFQPCVQGIVDAGQSSSYSNLPPSEITSVFKL